MKNRSLYGLFSSRFEPDGSDYLFRSSPNAPGVRVSASERDRFVTQFQRGWLCLRWGMFAAFIVAICLVAWLIIASVIPEAWLLPLIWGSLALLAAPYFVIYHRLWTAPARALRDHPQAAPARPVSEALGRLSWAQLRVTAATAASAVRRAGVALRVSGMQAFRKWRSSAPPPA